MFVCIFDRFETLDLAFCKVKFAKYIRFAFHSLKEI